MKVFLPLTNPLLMILIKISLLCSILIFANVFASYAQDCSSIKQGNFKIIDSKHGTTLITRNDSIQVEKNEKYDLELKFKIEWSTDCSYLLQLIEVIKDNSDLNYPNNLIVYVDIKEVNTNYYLHESTTNYNDIVAVSKVMVCE